MKLNLNIILLFLSCQVLVAQTIQPKQEAEIIIDNLTPGKANPGDRIRYKVTIENTGGASGQDMQLNIVPDPGTTFVSGSFLSSPLALDDAYDVTGNVGIDVAVANGLITNDFDDNPGMLTVTAGTFATTQGGSITTAADGGFTYTPPAGFTGMDTYVYTLNDGTPVSGGPTIDMATVTFTVSNVLWFIDNSSLAANSVGTLDAPFKTLSDFNASADPQDGHLIYIQNTGTNYPGGIVLKDNQILFGTGHTGGANLANVLPFTLATHSKTLPAINGTRPVIENSSGDGVAMALGNTLRGFNVGACSDFGMENTGTGSVGNLLISEVSIINTTGGGFRAGNGSGGSTNVIFTTISSTGGTNGIVLNNCSGTFTVNGGTITNPTGTGVHISGGSVVYTSSGVINKTNAGFAVDIDNHDSGNVTLSGNITSNGSGIRIQNCNGGTKTFSGSSKSLSTSTHAAVTLASNTGATINFNNGGMVINTTSGMGFSATGGGTVTVQGTGNTISSSSGATALNVVSTTIGGSNLNFQSISSLGGSATGIILDNTGTSGGLIVNGDGSNTALGGNGTGGTISGKTGANGSNVTGNGIFLSNTRNVVLRRMSFTGTKENFAIKGSTVINFTMEYCTVAGTNGNSAAHDEGSILFSELTGMASISFCNISGGFEDNINVKNSSGSLNRLTISNSTIGANSTTDGNDGILIGGSGTATINATIQNCTFTSSRSDLFQFNMTESANSDLIFSNNICSNNHPGIATGGGGITIGNDAGNMTLSMTNSTFKDAVGNAILIVNGTNLGAGSLTATISGNSVGVAATANSGSLEGDALKIQHAGGGGTFTVNVQNNTFRQYNNQGVHFQAGAGLVTSGNFNITFAGNTISNPGNNMSIGSIFQGLHLNNGVTPNDNFQTCMNIGQNTITNSGRNGGTDFRLRQRQNTTVFLPGYMGGNFDTGAVIVFVQGNLVTAASGSAAVETIPPVGGGFLGGGACILP
ncbi:MAG TPA: Ig-like domain-containing protein [Saprospiraceae bacterium]|nr:Ig-like domain-containing protein [Saprospiraceae bacterium]